MEPTVGITRPLILLTGDFVFSAGPWGKLMLDEVLVCPQCGGGTNYGEYTNFVQCDHCQCIYVPASCCEEVHALTGLEAARLLSRLGHGVPLRVLHLNNRRKQVCTDVNVAREGQLCVTVSPPVTITHIVPADQIGDCCEGVVTKGQNLVSIIPARDWLEFQDVPLHELERFRLPQPTKVLPETVKESNTLGFAGKCSKCGKPCQGELSES